MTPPGIDLPALRGFLGDLAAGPLRAKLITGGRSNLTYLVTDGVTRWVLRRPPLGPLTPSAHDMAREYRFVAALRDTAVPVADPVALCEDPVVLGAPFLVVSYVEGRTVRGADDAAALTHDEAGRCAAALVDTLATLHAVPVAALSALGRPAGYLPRQVRRWRDQWDRVATRALDTVDALHGGLAAALPVAGDATVVHGDFRLDNTILAPEDPGRVAAVVDWEMATLGDPLADLGLLLVYWDPVTEPVLGLPHATSANPGFPTASALAARYAQATGRDLGRLPFYRALGYFKLAVVAEGIHQRYLAGRTVGEGFDTVGAAVPALLDAGLEALR